MANINAPLGFRVVKTWTKPDDIFYIPASDATALGVGDPVVIAGSADADGVPTVTLATAGTTNIIDGFITGFSIASPNGRSAQRDRDSINYRPASTAMYAYVNRDPNVELEAQGDEALVAADIGLNADFVVGTPSATFGNSTAQIDSSTKGTGATKQFHIERLADGSEFGAYNKVIVTTNTHRGKGQTAGV